MLCPLLLVVPQIPLESLLAPGTIRWIRNRRESRNALVFARVLEKLASF